VEVTGMQQAEATLAVEQARHFSGLTTTNDLLAAEAQLRDLQTQYHLAQLDVVRTQVCLQMVTGRLAAAEPWNLAPEPVHRRRRSAGPAANGRCIAATGLRANLERGIQLQKNGIIFLLECKARLPYYVRSG